MSRYTHWSYWTPCSVSCGRGTKSRSRQLLPKWNNSPEADKDPNIYDCKYETTSCEAEMKSCQITKELMQEICKQPKKSGQCFDNVNDNSLRYYYDKILGKCVVFHYAGCNGNMNNFQTLQECQSTCCTTQESSNLRNYKVQLSSVVTYNVPIIDDAAASFKIKHEDDDSENKRTKKKKKKIRGETRSNASYDKRVDCKVSEWSEVSACYNCKGFSTLSRDILVRPRNGGKSCPTKLIKKQKCHRILPQCESVHCQVSQWSEWSSCTATCGLAERQRTRNVAVPARGPRGTTCPELVETEDCPVPAC